MQPMRPRRLRKNDSLRKMVEENILSASDLLAPLFILDGKKTKTPIASMPGINRYSVDLVVEECRKLYQLGVPAIALFPAIDDHLKNAKATESYNPDGLYQRAIKEIKNAVPELVIMTDVALDPYSSDGHDGLVDPKTGEILNDQTLEILVKMALVQAAAGADIIGPSDMMDGRVGAIRRGLEESGYHNVAIMSYTAKYASAFYGPFRDALSSAPKKGDKKSYQMNPANIREALLEAKLDTKEGADILMVKPGLAYLDVIKTLKDHSLLPIAAYNVSGEYAMVKAAAQNGWLDEKRVMMEMLTSFKRAGADIILTYFAEEAAKVLAE